MLHQAKLQQCNCIIDNQAELLREITRSAVDMRKLYPELLDLSPEGGLVHAELRGSRLPVPVVAAERLKEKSCLELVQVFQSLAVLRPDSLRRPEMRREVLRQDHPAPAQDKCVLDNVLELPHITGEIVPHEKRHHFGRYT